MLRLAIILALILFINGCSTSKPQTPLRKIQKQRVISKFPYKPKKKNWITDALYEEYKKWYKTPYKYGGTTLNGLDCSSLVQIVYKDAFGIKLPRTTKYQVKKGYYVDRNSIKEGDIVFFKTSKKARHSAIIIENDKFLHTSTKYGVSISSLNNPYWKSKYWQARRILPY